MAAGDFDGDGKTDLATASYGSWVSVLLGSATGLEPEVRYPVDSGPFAIVARDFNGDGKLDLATANNTGSSASVLMGTGDGTFGPATTYGLARVGQNNQLNQAVGITAADLNGDGALDFAVCTEQSSSSVFVFYNRCLP